MISHLGFGTFQSILLDGVSYSTAVQVFAHWNVQDAGLHTWHHLSVPAAVSDPKPCGYLLEQMHLAVLVRPCCRTEYGTKSQRFWGYLNLFLLALPQR